ncbi:NPC intracellular cholesterol transporter 2-like [Mya arenaria]|uniref:NPC intracellular cholesterol transporter 2-like n=1 Tax=Mya arenaria TaxID=6604 RepID=UPI0022E19FA3|nr:NPC intracellular cholesterol transporter 2-like [Mya arenaria]
MIAFVKVQLVLLSCVLCTGIYLKHFTDCGGHGTIHSILLEPCDSEPCHIFEDTTYHGTVNFTAGFNSQTALNKATAEIANAWGPFHVTPEDACGHGIICPVVKGETYTYTADAVPKNFNSSIRTVAKWMVVGDNNEYLICWDFPVFLNV